jgi:hypothetical protein
MKKQSRLLFELSVLISRKWMSQREKQLQHPLMRNSAHLREKLGLGWRMISLKCRLQRAAKFFHQGHAAPLCDLQQFAEVVTSALSVISEPCGIESAIERNSELHNSYSSDGDRPAVIEDSMEKTLNASVLVNL